ncbi:MAG: glycosyltransferase family 39 protein [Leptothrix ochracea]|uniref:glycosyltransferase family 39 protein n=1 Tax=Leptothrix ochracea TaxID=735331 RepID=UPI0034E1C53C
MALQDTLRYARHSTLLIGALVAHALLALAFHLSPDEAHYALYASHLDWSYFDHPPLVGWVQWPARMLGGSDMLMRVVPMLCWLLSAIGLMHLTRLLYPRIRPTKAYAAALLVWTLSPLHHMLGLALVPDTLLLPLTCAVMILSWHLADPLQLQRRSLWVLLGLSLGLAGLSKYTAVLLGLSTAWALGRAHGLRLLVQPGLWLAALLACLMITPVIGWNATNGWISFAYQLNHAAGQRSWELSQFMIFITGQLLAYGPLLLVGTLVASGMSMDTPKRRPGMRHQLRAIGPLDVVLCFGLPPLLLYTYLSGYGTTLPHWSAPAWLALVPTAAAGGIALWQFWRKTLIALSSLQVLVMIAIVASIFGLGQPTETGAQATSQAGEGHAPVNPVADLHGWDAAAQRALILANERGIPVLAVMNWSLASRVAWYGRPMPVKVILSHHDQFDLWYGPMQPGDSVLLLDWSLMSHAPPVGPAQFERCDLIEQSPVRQAGQQLAHFNYLHCQHWQGPKVSLDEHAVRPRSPNPSGAH